MSFFWPNDTKEDPGVLGRAGRVLHWTAIGVACLFGAGAWIAFTSEGTDPGLGWVSIVLGALAALGGRGLRYILAGE